MRLLKWITGIAGGLILIIIITAVIILSRYDFNSLKPFISKAVHDATGRELTIEKDIDLDIGLTPSLVLSGVKFQNADWGTRKDMLNVGRFELKVSLMPLLKGSVKVHRFILRDFDVLIETDKSGNANYQFDTGEKAQAEEKEAAPGTIPAFAVNKLEIENGVITYRDGKTGNTQSLTITNLKTGIKGFEDPLTIDLNGKYNDEPFKVSGTLGSIRGLNNPEFPWPFDLSINAFGTAAGFKGSIKNPAEQSGINIDFNVRINDWSFLSKLAEAEIPIKDALSITGNLTDRSSKNYNLSSAKVMLGQNQIDASADINLSGNTPFINAQISSKGIDLSPYIKESEAPEKGEEEKERLFSSEPLDLDTLKAINGRFKVSIDKLVLPDMVLNAVSLESAINDGRLELRPLKMSMAGGNIDVKLDIASRLDGADLSAAVNVEGLELAGLLEMVGIGDEIQGLVDMEIDIKGRGNSMAGIMGSLSGYSTVSVSEGVISNKYMGLLGSDFSKGVMRMLNPSKESKDYTAVRCMVMRFDTRDGIADATTLVVDTDMMSVAGSGTVNLKNETLNLSLDPSTKGGVAGYNLSIGELAQPFKLGGTLANPSLVLDKQKTAASIGKAIGKDGLKGLLRKESSETASADSEVDLCASALQAAKTGVKQAVKPGISPDAAAGDEKQQPVTTEKLIEDAIKDPKKALKNLFGK